MKLCECGCGQPVREGRPGRHPRYITGHNERGKPRLDLRKWKPRACEICGAEFYPKYEGQKLCSIDCRMAVLRERGGRKRAGKEVPCTYCGTPVYREPRQPGRPFCGSACQYAWTREQPRQISQAKRLALQRDSNACRICGFAEIVEVHHIVPRRKGGKDRLINLITLCPNHHTMADRNMIPVDTLRRLLDG